MCKRLLLALACLVLTVLWLPGAHYPIVSDTAIYALLGRSLWESGSYTLLGEPHTKYLPLHAFLSYPLTQLFGVHLGMKVLSLLGGFGVIVLTHLLLASAVSPVVGLLTALLLPLHHGFVLMTQLGSADLTFTTLFLAALWAYGRAEGEKCFYLVAGMFAGLASLTRLNGLPLFALFFLYSSCVRRSGLRSHTFWGGAALGITLAGLWAVRNAITFGNPFTTEYISEFQRNAPGLLEQFFSNVLFYVNPAHNILPILFVFSLYGIVRYARAYPLLFWGMLTAWPLTAFWWVQGMRFAFPGYPILIGFAVLGMRDLWQRLPRYRVAAAAACTAAILVSHLPAHCLYTYGACNAWFDRTFGWLPKNLGLSSEGFYTWDLARRFINEKVPRGATVLVDGPVLAEVWKGGVFREDLTVWDRAHADPPQCPRYRITQRPKVGEKTIFTTTDEPLTSVIEEACP